MLRVPTPELPAETHVKRLSILLIVVLAMLMAACSSDTTSSESQATATPEPTEEPTPSEAAAASGAAPSLEPGAGDLADLLPTEVGGLEMTYQSTSGEEVIGAQGVTPEAQAFFDRIGATPSDLSSAFGQGLDTDAGQFVTILAFRVAGADEGTLRDEFISTMESEGDIVGEDTTVGGKEVRTFGSEGAQSGFLYVKDDVVYIVGGNPASVAEDALAALP
jgi:hypothetical protein